MGWSLAPGKALHSLGLLNGRLFGVGVGAAGSVGFPVCTRDCYLHSDRSSSSTEVGRGARAGTCTRTCTGVSCVREDGLGSEVGEGKCGRSVKEGKRHDELTKSWTVFRSRVQP